MTAPVRTKGNVVWGTINGFWAPVDTATPFDDSADIGDPDSPWVGLPYTAEGFARTFSRETSEARVEEESNPVGKDITSTNWLVSLMIAEDTIDNQAIAMGGELTTVAAASGVIGHKKLTLSTTLEEVALCLIMPSAYKKADGTRYKDLLYIPSVVTTGDVETEYRRSPENKRTLPVTFEATCELGDIEIYSQTADALA